MCSTPWTMTRLVRWRVKDWASCFLACRFPLDDDPVERCYPTTPQLSIRNMAFEMQLGDSRGNETRDKRMSRHKRCNRARRLSHRPKQVKETSQVENRSSNGSKCRPPSTDEEYIVFCFKEDGAFDVVHNGKLKSPDSDSVESTSRNSPRRVNCKLNYCEHTKEVERCSNEESLTGKVRDIYPTNDDGKCIILDQKDEKEEEIYPTESPPPNIAEDRPTISVESSDSNQSDGSTGSFAFPVSGLEWTGSPVQMPKPQALDLRKHKARSVGFQFQCCRF